MARVVESFEVAQAPVVGTSFRTRASSAEQGSSVAGGVFNLANTIMGAALTGLPLVMSASGVVPFLAFLTLSAAAGIATLWMLVDVCNYLQGGRKDFQAVGKQAMGPHGLVLTAVATCLSCCGALTAYIVLVGTTSPVLSQLLKPVLGFEIYPQIFQCFTAAFLLFPLCLLRDISGLAPSSLFAMVVFILVAVSCLSKAFIGDSYYQQKHEADPIIVWFPAEMNVNAIKRLPTIIMAFNCQYAMLPIYQNLRGRRQQDMNRVCVTGIASAYVIYLTVACGGYLCYYQHTLDMILLNFRHCVKGPPLECEDDNYFFVILSGLFLLAVLLGYPCVHFAMRKAQVALILGPDCNSQWPLHAGLAIGNIVFTLALALAVGDHVGKVFSWTGAVASPLISFILPSLFSVKIWLQAGKTMGSPSCMLGLVMLIYGCAVMCLGITVNLIDAFSAEDKGTKT